MGGPVSFGLRDGKIRRLTPFVAASLIVAAVVGIVSLTVVRLWHYGSLPKSSLVELPSAPFRFNAFVDWSYVGGFPLRGHRPDSLSLASDRNGKLVLEVRFGGSTRGRVLAGTIDKETGSFEAGCLAPPGGRETALRAVGHIAGPALVDRVPLIFVRIRIYERNPVSGVDHHPPLRDWEGCLQAERRMEGDLMSM